MRCIECGSDQMRTLETRARPGALRRRRECGRCGHTFPTVELPETVVRTVGVLAVERAVLALLRGIQRRVAARENLARITQRLREGWKPTAIANEVGVTEERVRQVRKELRGAQQPSPNT